MLKNRIPQVQKIPQHRNSELKFPKYRKKNGPIPQYRKPQCPPPLGTCIRLLGRLGSL